MDDIEPNSELTSKDMDFQYLKDNEWFYECEYFCSK